MGVHENIQFDRFPRQGPHVGKRVLVIFDYNSAPNRTAYGVLVRDDYEHPYRGIIALDDGRFLMTIECQYRIL